MITILHGDSIEASRAELVRLKEKAKGKEIRELEARGLDETNLTQALSSSSLFGGDTLIVLTNFLKSLGRKNKNAERLCVILTDEAKTADILLWEDKEISASILKLLGTGATVRIFKLPTIIFQFLDSLAPGNTKKMLTLYEQLTEIEAPELIHAVMGKRIRQLLMLADGVTPPGLQGWQAGRLTSQAKLFSIEKLQSFYQLLAAMEYEIKTGISPFPLRERTRLALVDL